MIWAQIWAWLKKVPGWVWLALLAVVGLLALRSDARQDGKRRAEQEHRENEIREQARARERLDKLIEEENTRADDAIEVGRGAPPAVPDELSDAEFRDIFGYDRPRE